MTFEEWWEREDRESVPFSDFTYGEEVWNAAKHDAWGIVFQIVSDHPQMATREFIRKLEAARDQGGYGPL